jgi:hypothetical protein
MCCNHEPVSEPIANGKRPISEGRHRGLPYLGFDPSESFRRERTGVGRLPKEAVVLVLFYGGCAVPGFHVLVALPRAKAPVSSAPSHEVHRSTSSSAAAPLRLHQYVMSGQPVNGSSYSPRGVRSPCHRIHLPRPQDLDVPIGRAIGSLNPTGEEDPD